MRKLALFLLCLSLVGSVALAAENELLEGQRICDMNFRKIVILGEGITNQVAFQYAASYRAVVWHKETTSPGIVEPGPAMKELIIELQGINDTEEKWEFIIPGIAEEFFFVTLKNMDNDSLSKAKGTVYLPDSSKNESMEAAVQRVSNGSFVVIYGR
ncbi:MAG: hypothetical protein KJ706_08900 [Candidatus Omnitrophica bacterium]|nr:hypothetical protein [Candidatus Omnitrophota bacterium]MBU4590109.1 hypothetical protein [Candidatus Omnitrophota bacterium]